MRTALVTGSASGIGNAIAHRLTHTGWRVIGIDTTPSENSVTADVSDRHQLAAVEASLGDQVLDAIVCAAGIWHPEDGSAMDLQMDVWEATWNVNVTGVWLTVNAFGGRLRSGSSILTVASLAGLVGMPRMTAYTASKGAVVSLTRSWAREFIERGIRVNCICPGVVETPMTESALSRGSVGLPLKRPAGAEEVAFAACAALAPENSYLNGAIIPVDGGITATSSTVVW